MGITLTNGNEFRLDLLAEIRRADMLTVRALSMLGEMTVSMARSRSAEDSWIDRTGNLRSSVGYIVLRDGEIVSASDFGQVKQGADGSKAGRQFAEEIARDIHSDYALIVVAGMNYASYVEAIESKDVLAGPELFARKNLPVMLKKLERQIVRG